MDRGIPTLDIRPPHPSALATCEFADLLEECRRFLLRLAAEQFPRSLTAKAGASDLVQATLEAAWSCRTQFRGQTLGELRAWLRGILAHELSGLRRRYASKHRDVSRECGPEPVTGCKAGTAPPDLAATRAEEVRHMAALVDELPEVDRLTVVLRMEKGMAFAAIGERLGRSEEAVRKVFSRALARLRGLVPPEVT